MSNNYTQLLSVASNSISPTPTMEDLNQLPVLSGTCGQELLKLLGRRNGFYAFESSLLVRPLNFDGSPFGIFQWNNTTLWKAEYKIDFGNAVFFAEDIFGMQFCIKDDLVTLFDPETGDWKIIANSLGGWIDWIFKDSKITTGWPLAHDWQVKQGPLKFGTRLLPKVPFVLGGQFSIVNLYALNDAEGMRFRANIANQLHDCPDGSKVILRLD
jgi:hypothetical protein